MDVHRNATWMATVVALAGIALHAYTAVFNVTPDRWPPVTLGLMVWSTVPYAICIGLASREDGPGLPAALAAAFALVVDVVTYLLAFHAPGPHEPMWFLLGAPLLNLAVALPAGFALGHRIEARRRP